ncbi:MAG: hypothetical protein ABEI98_05275 [Halorhabdus sp.]
MSHQCEDCGETFETLTRLRLHDCPESTRNESDEATAADRNDQAPTDQETETVNADLDDLLNQADRGQLDVLPEAIAMYESALQSAHEKSGDRYREVFWEYYEPLADALDRYTRADGWTVLQDFVDAYHPQASDELPFAIPVIENAVGRLIIRTRLVQPAHYIPEEALSFLRSIPLNAPEGADVAFEEAQTYGWGIDHPDYPTADHLHEMASEHMFWAQSSLEHAFYADQHAAVELLERLVRDEPVDVSVSYVTGTAGTARFFLDCVAGPDSDEYWPQIPRYWDWHNHDAFAFEWDPEVEERIRTLVHDTEVDEELPTDWTFQDLAV